MRLTLAITAEKAVPPAPKQLTLMLKGFQNESYIKDCRILAGFVVSVIFCLKAVILISALEAVSGIDFIIFILVIKLI